MDLKTDLGSRLVDSTAITESEYFSTRFQELFKTNSLIQF